MSQRLKFAEIKVLRLQTLSEQGGKCLLCGQILTSDKAVLDHCHKTGMVRGVIHNGCNSLLGKLENNAPRYGVKDLQAFLIGAASYLQRPPMDILHPTYRTPEEKRLLRNKRARLKRKK